MPAACAGRVALVTGASRGIGAAIARRLAAEGASVAVLARTVRPGDVGLPGSLEETVDHCRSHDVESMAVPADLSDPGAPLEDVVARVEDVLGPVDVLVNAAAAIFAEPFDQLSDRRFRVAVEVNVRAPWRLMAAASPSMRERGGAILNVTSASALLPVGPPFEPGQFGGACLYGGTKAMLERVTVGVAAELFPTVAVNALAPEAAVRTAGADAVAALPDDRIEPVETVVEAALALVTGDPSTLTGRVAYSLSLLCELERPVRDLDGVDLVAGWQPDEIDPARLRLPVGGMV